MSPAASRWKRRRWCCLQAVVFPSDGAVPGAPPRICLLALLAALRRPREGTHFAGVHVQVDLAIDDLEGAVREDQGGVAIVVRGGGAAAPRNVDS